MLNNISRIIFGIKCLLRILFILANNVYCLPAYLAWIFVVSILKYFNSSVYWKIEGLLYRWLLFMVGLWSSSAGYDIIEMGDDISTCFNEETLIIINHQSSSDVPLLMSSLVTKPSVMENAIWIMDSMFRFTNFGLVSTIHKDFFITSGREYRDTALIKLSEHLKTVYKSLNRKWIILFPEGGFLRKKRASSQIFAAKYNLPVLQHVALPRVGAFLTILNTLHPGTKVQNAIANTKKNVQPTSQLKWVVDLTIGYPNAVPLNLQTIVMGNRNQFQTVFYFRKYPITDIPYESDDDIKRWLFKCFEEKDQMLDVYYKSGTFPTSVCSLSTQQIHSPLLVEHSVKEAIFCHLFFLISFILSWKLIVYLYGKLFFLFIIIQSYIIFK